MNVRKKNRFAATCGRTRQIYSSLSFNKTRCIKAAVRVGLAASVAESFLSRSSGAEILRASISSTDFASAECLSKSV